MSDVGELRDEGLQPSSTDLLRYSNWFLQLIDRDRNPDYRDKTWDLLRVLLIQHKADWEDATSPKSVSTQDLWRLAQEEHGEEKSDVNGDTARKRVNDHWGDLITGFAEFEGRFIDAARKAGFSGLLWPKKNQSSGGKSSTYYLEWRDFGQAVAQPPLPPGYNELPFVLRYREDKSSVRFSWIGRLFFSLPLLFKHRDATTVRVEGLRRWIPAIAMALLAVFIGAMVVLALILSPASGLHWNLVILAALIYWFYLRPLTQLYDRRIIMMSPLFFPFKDRDCQVEVLWDVPAEKETPSRAYDLRLVRFAADCPMCDGKVWLEDGKCQFMNRLVGRCSEEPGEHVFSFDHKLRAGYWLRK